MGTTPLTAIVTPEYGASTFTDLLAMATALEKLGVPRFATATARDASITSPELGQLAAVAGNLTQYNGTAWLTIGSPSATITTPSSSSSQSAAGVYAPLDSLLQTIVNNIAYLFNHSGGGAAAPVASAAFTYTSPATAQSGYDAPLAYKHADGSVIVRGGYTGFGNGTMSQGTWTTIMTVPTGYRPTTQVFAPAMFYGSFGTTASGTNNLTGSGNETWPMSSRITTAGLLQVMYSAPLNGGTATIAQIGTGVFYYPAAA